MVGSFGEALVWIGRRETLGAGEVAAAMPASGLTGHGASSHSTWMAPERARGETSAAMSTRSASSHSLREGVPPALRAVIDRATRRRRRTYAGASELAADIQRFLDGGRRRREVGQDQSRDSPYRLLAAVIARYVILRLTILFLAGD